MERHIVRCYAVIRGLGTWHWDPPHTHTHAHNRTHAARGCGKRRGCGAQSSAGCARLCPAAGPHCRQVAAAARGDGQSWGWWGGLGNPLDPAALRSHGSVGHEPTASRAAAVPGPVSVPRVGSLRAGGGGRWGAPAASPQEGVLLNCRSIQIKMVSVENSLIKRKGSKAAAAGWSRLGRLQSRVGGGWRKGCMHVVSPPAPLGESTAPVGCW